MFENGMLCTVEDIFDCATERLEWDLPSEGPLVSPKAVDHLRHQNGNTVHIGRGGLVLLLDDLLVVYDSYNPSRHVKFRFATLCTECGESPNLLDTHPHIVIGSEKEGPGADAEDGEICFSCNFWHEMVSLRNDTTRYKILIGGSVLSIDLTNPNPPRDGGMRGFGGYRFRIAVLDGTHKGKIIDSTNVWSNGDCPVRYRHLFPHGRQVCPEEN